MSRSPSETSDASVPEPAEGTLRPSDHFDSAPAESTSSPRRAPEHGIRRDHPARARPGGMAAVGMAPAHEHAHRARPPAAARDRGGARLDRAAAHRRPERGVAVLRRQSRPGARARQPAAVRRLHLGLVLVDLHPAVRLPHRMRDPAHEAPLEGPARASAAHARASRAPRRPPVVARRARTGVGCRRRRRDRDRHRDRAVEARRLPRRALRRARHAVGLGRARLRARDRQPRLPHGVDRGARRGGRRRRLHVHRPDA